MHSNSPLHLFSVYLLHIYISIYIYTHIVIYILTYMALPCNASSISTCADFRQTIRSAYLILRIRYIYLSPLPFPPLPLTLWHVTPRRCTYVCVLLVVGQVCFRFCCVAMRCGCKFVVRFGLFSNWEIRFLVFLR